MRATKIFDWHCAHLLEGHNGLCKNVHGHTYKLEVEVEGDLIFDDVSSEGMVIDFSDLKSIVKTEIVDKFDHALVLNHGDSGDAELYELAVKKGWKILRLPFRTTAENMAKWIYQTLNTQKRLTGDFRVVRIRLYETDTSYAEVSKND